MAPRAPEWAAPRGIYNRLAAGDRFSSRAIFSDAQLCLHTALRHFGFSTYQMAFGATPVNPFTWHDDDGVLEFAQDTSISGQFAQLWALRTVGQEATLKETFRSSLEGKNFFSS